MLKQDVLDALGSQSAIARVLGISRQSVHAWGEVVPFRKAVQLAKRGIPLRPEDYAA